MTSQPGADPQCADLCADCRNGVHDWCRNSPCGCLANHPNDGDMMAEFKRLKRLLHPECEDQVKGGWRQPIRVKATVGKPKRAR